MQEQDRRFNPLLLRTKIINYDVRLLIDVGLGVGALGLAAALYIKGGRKLWFHPQVDTNSPRPLLDRIGMPERPNLDLDEVA